MNKKGNSDLAISHETLLAIIGVGILFVVLIYIIYLVIVRTGGYGG